MGGADPGFFEMVNGFCGCGAFLSCAGGLENRTVLFLKAPLASGVPRRLALPPLGCPRSDRLAAFAFRSASNEFSVVGSGVESAGRFEYLHRVICAFGV